MTTFLKLTSPNSATAPFAFGVGFAKGDIPSSFATSDLANYQVNVKRRWNDGSVKTATVSGFAALTANVQKTVTFAPGTPPTGTSLTAADIATAVAAAGTTAVQCGSYGTVNLSSLTATPFQTWDSGPQMINCIYRAGITGTHLHAWFDVRLFAGGKMDIIAWVENGYLDDGAGAVATNADVTYSLAITLGGTVVQNNGGVVLTHCPNTCVFGFGWVGGDPQVTPQHDVAYMRGAAKLTQNYARSNPNNTTLNALLQTYTPNVEMSIYWDMTGAGANPSIALLPHWNALYMGTADARAYRATIVNSLSMGSYGISWRDATTKKVLKPSNFASWSVDGPGGSATSGVNLSNGSKWEINHAPGESYLAYLLTGRYAHYELLLKHAATCYITRSTGATGVVTMGSGTSRKLVHQVRGTAWTIRTLSLLAAIAPDSEIAAGGVAAEYRTLLVNNVAYWKSVTQTAGINQLGYLYEYGASGSLDAYGPGWSPSWQHDWWAASMGLGSDLEPLADMTEYNFVRDWLYKGVVGRVGDSSGFYFGEASTYAVKISDASSLDPTTWLDSWATVYQRTFAHLSGGADSIAKDDTLINSGNPAAFEPVPNTTGAGGPADAEFGRWGYLLPALCYAAEHGAPGAAASYARVTGATNYSTLNTAGFDQAPQWDATPRSIPGEAMTAISGPTSRVDTGNEIPGCTIVGSTPGYGLLAQDITSGGTDGSSPLFASLEFPADQDYEVSATLVTAPTGTFTLELGDDGSLYYSGGANVLMLQFWKGVQQVGAPKLVTFSADGTPSIVTGVTISPTTATGSVTFTGTVEGSGSPSQALTYAKMSGPGTLVGAAYTEPAATNSIQYAVVRATSVQDPDYWADAVITIAASITPVTATSVTVTFENRSGDLQSNLAGMKWAFFDQPRPDLLSAPVAKGSAESTNSAGVLVLDITGTALLSGATGYLVFSNTDGTASQAGQIAFAGPVVVV
jgi:hypothetical protein